MPKTILVTGGSGFLGRAVLERVLRRPGVSATVAAGTLGGAALAAVGAAMAFSRVSVVANALLLRRGKPANPTPLVNGGRLAEGQRGDLP